MLYKLPPPPCPPLPPSPPRLHHRASRGVYHPPTGGISSRVSVYIIKGAPPLYHITPPRASSPRRPSPSPSAAPPPLPKGEADIRRTQTKVKLGFPMAPPRGELARNATERGLHHRASRGVYHPPTGGISSRVSVYIITTQSCISSRAPRPCISSRVSVHLPAATPTSARLALLRPLGRPPSHPCHKKAKFPMFSAKTP